jgi:glutathione S-transferase
MPDPILYGPAFSTYTRSVRLALEEKGVPYVLEEIDIFSGANATPEYLARQPFGKVPALEHDGFRLYETGAILRYVDEAFEGPGLQPSDVRDRARMTQAIGILDAYTYPCVIGQIVIQRLVTPLMGGEPDEDAVAGAVDQARTCVKALDALFDDGPYLAGGSLSLADLHLVPVYQYFMQTPEGEKLLAGASNLPAWWSKMSDRPSVIKTTPSLG